MWKQDRRYHKVKSHYCFPLQDPRDQRCVKVYEHKRDVSCLVVEPNRMMMGAQRTEWISAVQNWIRSRMYICCWALLSISGPGRWWILKPERFHSRHCTILNVDGAVLGAFPELYYHLHTIETDYLQVVLTTPEDQLSLLLSAELSLMRPMQLRCCLQALGAQQMDLWRCSHQYHQYSGRGAVRRAQIPVCCCSQAHWVTPVCPDVCEGGGWHTGLGEF